MREYSTVTCGDVIAISYNNTVYELLCMETKPANTISIVETDLEVDFAPPVGYIDPSQSSKSNSSSEFKPVNIKQPMQIDQHILSSSSTNKKQHVQDAFSGQGQRLSGKPMNAPTSLPQPTTYPDDQSKEQENTTNQPLALPDNTLWFGYTVKAFVKETTTTADDDDKEDTKKQQPPMFEGGGNSLRK